MSTESLIPSTLEDDNTGVVAPVGPVKMQSHKAVIILLCIGIVAVIVGITIGCLWASIFNSILLHELILTPTSKSFSMWKQTPIPMYLEIHLFHWTNPHEFTTNSQVKPHFEERGPYVFKEVDSKVNQVWNNNNGTTTFQQRRVWHFVPSKSNGSLSDRITNLNPVATTIAYMIRHKMGLIKKAANSFMNIANEKLTVTKTVNELLFEGYSDELLKLASKLPISGLKYDKFGWFYSRNNSDSYDGTFNMLTGATNIKDLGTLKEWNYNNRSKYYKDTCGMINGTLGDLWPPMKDAQTVSVFASDVCTSMTLRYNMPTEYNGLTGNQFLSTKDMLDNGTNVPSRACYCKDVECQPSGTFNVSMCKFGAPAFISSPHFYLADESYRSAIDGMNPRKEDHQFSMVVEPNTGLPMQVRARLQLNLLVNPDPSLTIFKNTPKTFIPMLWFEQKADLSSDLAGQVKIVLILHTWGHVTFFGIAGIGALLLFISAALYIRRRRVQDDGQILIPKRETNEINGHDA